MPESDTDNPRGMTADQEIARAPSPYPSPMISYAQNFEDITLRRALMDIETGFYVDVGAFHPCIDSVTNWFYSQGWSGINIEPQPHFAGLLREERPRDINLQCALGARPGNARLHVIGGLSTKVDEFAERHIEAGVPSEPSIDVEQRTLAQVFEEHVAGKTVDFLKIDVEGAEAEIINTFDFATHRPRIVVVEATMPNSREENWADWEPKLLRSGYRFAWFDQLNRFYAREEDGWRAGLMARPPSVFDNFRFPAHDRRVIAPDGLATS
jgi:FkbM family methyltransferase